MSAAPGGRTERGDTIQFILNQATALFPSLFHPQYNPTARPFSVQRTYSIRGTEEAQCRDAGVSCLEAMSLIMATKRLKDAEQKKGSLHRLVVNES